MPTRPLAALLAAALALAASALAQEDWQLAHGPFVTASDVRAHNALGADIAEITAALAAPEPDFTAALTLYAFGKNFPWRDRTHSLGRFGDDYNGKIAAVLPASTAHFGSPSFQAEFMFAALAGTSRFQDAEPAERVAAAEGGALATVINWTRFELAEAQSKATAAEPNWSLENGSPKNWNEIFAFHFGPGGANSVHAALEASPEGADINAALYDALTSGQERIVAEAWAPDEAAEVAAILDRGAVLLLAAELDAAAMSDGAARETARARAAGLWRAAAEAVLRRDSEAAAIFEAASSARPRPKRSPRRPPPPPRCSTACLQSETSGDSRQRYRRSHRTDLAPRVRPQRFRPRCSAARSRSMRACSIRPSSARAARWS